VLSAVSSFLFVPYCQTVVCILVSVRPISNLHMENFSYSNWVIYIPLSHLTKYINKRERWPKHERPQFCIILLSANTNA